MDCPFPWRMDYRQMGCMQMRVIEWKWIWREQVTGHLTESDAHQTGLGCRGLEKRKHKTISLLPALTLRTDLCPLAYCLGSPPKGMQRLMRMEAVAGALMGLRRQDLHTPPTRLKALFQSRGRFRSRFYCL